MMLYFAYGFGSSIAICLPLVGYGILRRSFRAGFEVTMD